jgi:DNA (cytosine-5)-methyltransferase 1
MLYHMFMKTSDKTEKNPVPQRRTTRPCSKANPATAEVGGRSRAQESTTARPVAVDLFSGAGGLSLGFEQAGFDVVAALEYDPVHAAVHAYNFPKTAVLCENVTAVSADDVRNAALAGYRMHGREANSWNREIDVVFGGPPCQGFSLMGARAVDDERNNLVFEFARLVAVLKPRYFVMENVAGMNVGEHAAILKELIVKLRRVGYDVAEPQVLNAAAFGVPQDRRRIFVLGTRQGCKPIAYPAPTTRPATEEMDSRADELPLGPTVWDAIRDLRHLGGRRSLYDIDEATVSNAALSKANEEASQYAKRLTGTVCDPSDLSYPRVFDRRRVTSTALTRHKPKIAKRFKRAEHDRFEVISKFFKLSANRICNTLRAGTGSDHGSHTSARPIHPTQPRVLTVREAARLQSFPDWFRFNATKWHGFRQVGNSVPPLLARAVAAQVAKALEVAPKKPVNVLPMSDDTLLGMNARSAAEHFGAKSPPTNVRRNRDDQVPEVRTVAFVKHERQTKIPA